MARSKISPPSPPTLESNYAWLKIELGLATSPESKFIELLNKNQISSYDIGNIVEFLGIGFFSTPTFTSLLFKNSQLQANTGFQQRDKLAFLSPDFFLNEDFFKELQSHEIQEVLNTTIFRHFNNYFVVAKNNLILASRPDCALERETLIEPEKHASLLSLPPQEALLEAAWLYYEHKYKTGFGLTELDKARPEKVLSASDKLKFFNYKKMLDKYVLTSQNYENIIAANLQTCVMFENLSDSQKDFFDKAYIRTYLPLLDQNKPQHQTHTSMPAINFFLSLKEGSPSIKEILTDLHHLYFDGRLNVKTLQYLKSANQSELIYLIDAFSIQCANLPKTQSRSNPEELVKQLINQLVNLKVITSLTASSDLLWPLIEKHPSLSSHPYIALTFSRERFLDALKLNPSMINNIHSYDPTHEYVMKDVVDKDLILECLSIKPLLLLETPNPAWFETNTLTSFLAQNKSELNNFNNTLLHKKIKKQNKKFYALKNLEDIIDNMQQLAQSNPTNKSTSIFKLSNILNNLIESSDFKKCFDKPDCLNVYNKYLEILKLTHSRASFVPPVLLKNVDYILEKIKDNPHLKLDELCTPFLVYSKKYCLFLLNRAMKSAQSEDIDKLKSYLPTPMIEFFKKSGFEHNMFSAATSLIEKSNLKDSISGRTEPFTLTFEVDMANNILSKTLPNKEKDIDLPAQSKPTQSKHKL